MGLRIGNIELVAPKGTDLTSSIPAGTQGVYATDVLVGINHVYVLAGNMNTVAQFNKNPDGTIGTFIRTINWYSNDALIANICAANSSVPYSYALYVQGGVEYLVGWGLGNLIYRWALTPATGAISGRVSYNAPFVMSSYSRAGWDGGSYIYFAQMPRNTTPRIANIYRWDLTNPTVAPVFVVKIPDTFSMDSSFTGSGLVVKGNTIYWGSGANQSNGFLAGFDLTTGLRVTPSGTANPISASDLQSIGVTPIATERGNISLNALHPTTAYYFATALGRIRYIEVSYNMRFKDKVAPTDTIYKRDFTFSGMIEHALGSQVNYRIKVNNTVLKDWSGLVNTPITISETFANDLFPIGTSNLIIEAVDSDEMTFTEYTLITKTNVAPKITNNSTLRIHREDFVLKASLTDTDMGMLSYRVLVGGVQKSPENGWTDYAPAPTNIEVPLSNDMFVVGSTTVRLEVMDDWFVPAVTALNMTVTKATYTPTLASGVFDRTNLHKEDVTYSATITDQDVDDKVSYRILINGVEVIPWSEYQAVPTTLTHTFPHTAFRIGSNTFLLQFTDDYQTPAVNSSQTTITKTNTNASIVQPAAVTIHGEDLTYRATINDSQGDPVQYRMFLNNVQVYPENGDFSDPFPSPIAVARMFRNSELNIGANAIKIEAKDDMQASATSSTYTVTKNSVAPTVTVPDIKGWVVRATVNDGNSDKVGYRISYGGVQIYPESGYTELTPTPFDIEYAIPADKVSIGVSRALLIELIDEYGVVGSRSTNVILKNGGLVLSPVPWGYVQSTTNGHYIRYANNALNNLSRTGQMTMEGWFCKTGQGATNPRAIPVSKGATYIDIGYNGGILISVVIAGTQRTFPVAYAPKMNVWEHYAFTYDGTEVKFYANGEYIPATFTNYQGAVTNTNVIDIGRFYTGSYNFVGGITEVRMWDVARTEEEIRSAMCDTLTGKEEGLVFYPDLGTPNRPTAATVADLTGQAAGTMTGSLPYSDALIPTFTTGDGTVVSNVDLGRVVATYSSEPVRVCLRNFSGYCIENIRITSEQWELDPVSEVVELSYSNEPFVPLKKLIINDYVDHTQYTKFWVRVNAGADALGGGLCKLHVKADITFT
ncbi:LamG domain-containing protein [Paenibacillus pabuli]|uniref:LamG domain-containing protein n=1 Tax=Paenibacillus pabuli TaxID=1472 RepID=UPI003CF2C73E